MPLSSSFFVGSVRLEGVLAGSEQPVRPSLVKDTGDTVERIQKALVHLKYLDATKFKTGGPDGYYGDDTRNAVIAFQKTIFPPSQYLEWDGRVGPKTLFALDTKLAGSRRTPGSLVPGPPGITPVNPVPGAALTAQCTQNQKITLDGTNAPAVRPPMTAAQWIEETQETFDLLCGTDLGKKYVALIKKPLTIVPFVELDKTTGLTAMSAMTYNAGSSYNNGVTYSTDTIEFTPSVSAASLALATRRDEVLFHEMVHVLAPRDSNYPNPADATMQWDTDFYTISATNVYISSLWLGRKLRKDHGVPHFVELPLRYANAIDHMIIFRENYDALYVENQVLFDLLKNAVVAMWNPFKEYTRKPAKNTYQIEVKGTSWTFIIELYDDKAKTARWRDPNRADSYGTGSWYLVLGRDVMVNWTGGSWDSFTQPSNFFHNSTVGTCTVGGVKYDTRVTRYLPFLGPL
jgi:Putative peptidoglycan binding domain